MRRLLLRAAAILADVFTGSCAAPGRNDDWNGSADFVDQVDLWQRRDYIRMPLRPDSIAAELETVMTLKN